MLKGSYGVWVPEGIEEENNVTVSNGQIYELPLGPYKYFEIDVLNQTTSTAPVKVMVNGQNLTQASTLQVGEGRVYDAKSPKYWRVAFYVDLGQTANVRVTISR